MTSSTPGDLTRHASNITPPHDSGARQHEQRERVLHSRWKDDLAKPSETSRPRHHPDDLPRDVTLLAHPHAPPLSTYDVQEPSRGLQELREMNGARTEIPENAEDAEIQAGSIVEAPSARTSEDLR